jgi:hypothetical protein
MNQFFKNLFAPGIASDQWNLNKWDYIKATVLAVFAVPIGMVMTALTQWTNGQPFKVDWSDVLKISLSCAATYLFKNFFSPSSNPPLK